MNLTSVQANILCALLGVLSGGGLIAVGQNLSRRWWQTQKNKAVLDKRDFYRWYLIGCHVGLVVGMAIMVVAKYMRGG